MVLLSTAKVRNATIETGSPACDAQLESIVFKLIFAAKVETHN